MKTEHLGSAFPLWAYVTVVIGALSGFTYAFLASAVERHRRRICHNHLNNCIDYACHLYTSDFEHLGGPFPPTLGDLYPHFASTGAAFVCPSADKATLVEHRPDFWRDDGTRAPLSDMHTDYAYVSGLKAGDPEDYIVAFDDEWNHDGDGVHVLCVGLRGPLDRDWWPDIEALHDQLAKQEKELAAKGRKMKVLRAAWSSWPDPPAGGHPLWGPWPWYRRRRVPAVLVGVIAALAVVLVLVVRTVRRGRKPDSDDAVQPER